MCNDKKQFSELDENVHGDVYTAAGHSVKSLGVGDIRMDVKLSHRVSNNIKLQDAIYVPNLRNNLVSISSVTEKGYSVTFHENKATINRLNGSIVATAVKKERLYVMCETKNQTLQLTQNKRDDLLKWHWRYGHLNIDDLRGLATNNMVSGLNFNSVVKNINCEICQKSKIH